MRDGGERARRADAGGARRSRARDRLFDRRQGRTRGENRRNLPGGFPSSDHLSGRGDDDREGGSRRLSGIPALIVSQNHLRKIRLQVSGEPDDLTVVFDISPTEWTAIALSLRVATVATLIATPFGIAVAWLLARRDFRGRSVVGALIHLPLVVRPIRLSIEAVDRRLEQAADTLGAAPWQVFLTITLPLALPGVLAGMVLGFAKAIGEFGATITFVSNIPGETQTISSAIYSLIQTPDGDTAALRLVVASIVIAMAALVASEWFAGRGVRRLHGN